jgi:multidrug efflux pump subunit AcrA (membrane-fusion protein)
MNRMNQTLTVVSLLITALGVGLSGCSNEHTAQPVAQETERNVSVIVAQRTTVPEWLEAVGTVRAVQTSQVASQMMGNIVEIRAHEGDRVQNGQVLAMIDGAQPRSAVDQAMAGVTAAEKEVSVADSDLALAAATLKRYQQLYEKNRSVLRNLTRSRPAASQRKRATIWRRPDRHRQMQG